jgi:hypothetical protein
VTAVCVAFVAGILPAGPRYCQSLERQARLPSRLLLPSLPSESTLTEPATGSRLKTSYISACRAVGKGICDE